MNPNVSLSAPPNKKRKSIRIRSTIARSLVLMLGVAGCNAILENEPGKPEEKQTEVTPTQPSAVPDSAPPAPPIKQTPDATTSNPPPPPPTLPDAGPGGPICGAGTTICHGFCVGVTDPMYGCGSATCTACQAGHATSMCQNSKCALAACDKGYSDCDQNPDNGCEVDLSKPASCGSCNAVCPPATPICAPSGDTFHCTTGCTPAAPLLCGQECVSPLTSVNHCGGCNVKCPDVAHATSSCEVGSCNFTCQAGYHKCGTTCAVATDTTACGPTCAVCATPANATPTCAADTCGFQCTANFGNCNGAPADGCETDLLTNPSHCGACGVPCGTNETCEAGLCKAPPPPPPDGG